MKHLIVILLVLLLTGCAAEAPGTVATAAQPTEAEVLQDTTEQFPEKEEGSYFLNSAVEMETDGAVWAYDVGIEDCRAIYPMGERMLLFSGYDTTTLTVLEGESLRISEQKTLECLLEPDSSSVQISEKGIVYYNDSRKTVVFLDVTLQEISRAELPANIQGNAVISPKRDTVYYCTSNAIRALDLRTGLSRLVKGHNVETQTLNGVYFDGSVLRCDVIYDNGTADVVYLSTETGETLCSGKTLNCLYSDDETYITSFEDGSVMVFLTGNVTGEPQMLRIAQTAVVYPLFDLDALAVMETGDEQTELSCMNVETGKKTNTVIFPYGTHISFITGGAERVWMIAEEENTSTQFVYCWDLGQTQVQDSESNFQPYYTAENPDTVGLVECKAQAEALGEKYGVNILVGENALWYQPEGYFFEMEYQVAAYERDLKVLESALDQFPEGFFETAAEGTSNGDLTISLVRSMDGDESMGSAENSVGVQYWMGESAYVALTMGWTLEQTLYHELSHVIDNRVISTTPAYDDWASLNPEGFEYDYSYILNQYRENEQYLEEERAFIDTYSMSYPKEDRARILEYAMMLGNGSYFSSQIMQNKLRTLCLGIREAFELDSVIVYPWEQYLQEPLLTGE